MYERGRPEYPAEAVDWMLGPAAFVADVGAGTGKLTRGVFGSGRFALAVDPDEKMLDKMTVLSIAPLIARAIREIFDDGSVTSLFDGDA